MVKSLWMFNHLNHEDTKIVEGEGNRVQRTGRQQFLFPVPCLLPSFSLILRTLRGFVVYCGVVLLLGLTGCLGLGYHVGTKSLFGQDIRTVYVPIFESDIDRPDIGERLTEAVCKRIEAKSPYKVVGRPDADSVLTGKVVSEKKSITLYNRFGDVRQLQGTMSVHITWKDRRNQELRQFDEIPWNESSATVRANNYFLPEYGQSIATSEMEQIDRIADQIVGMMEIPW